MRPNKFTQKTTTTYYHISAIKNKESILANGLISDESEIFLCTSFDQLKMIAFNQLFLNEYSIFEVSTEGLTGEIIQDNVAEVGSGFQYIVKQNKIESKYLKFVNDAKFHYFDLAEDTNRVKARVFGMDEDQYIEMLVSTNEKWCEHYNAKYNKNISYNQPKVFNP
ncbi:hypothetical protein [Flavobacterium sp. SORGH_AS_0622]|uniref:hypothetical protein n=1 Tax=Flavobacterium sp. SORGH_AS_0622 TaxID=3041772 RepID=UPI002781F2C9|nr:hypothetical protein [Flavobacterium sp. SORGH_AS_0622]MDQ1165892.1 DNA-binding ferritin-like protein (Dps family) [Flavobacterium sp. SORGH_AS_0622]